MRRAIVVLAVSVLLAAAGPLQAADLSPAQWPEAERQALQAGERTYWTSKARDVRGAVLITGSASPVAIHAGMEALRQGGSAADAATVVALTQVARTVVPLLLKRGSFPLFMSKPVGPVFGNFGAGIDRVAIVRYRSLHDLLDMSADPEMTRGGPQKFLALAHTEVFATRPVINAFQVRIFLGLAFLLLGAAGWWILSRLERRRG